MDRYISTGKRELGTCGVGEVIWCCSGGEADIAIARTLIDIPRMGRVRDSFLDLYGGGMMRGMRLCCRHVYSKDPPRASTPLSRWVFGPKTQDHATRAPTGSGLVANKILNFTISTISNSSPSPSSPTSVSTPSVLRLITAKALGNFLTSPVSL